MLSTLKSLALLTLFTSVSWCLGQTAVRPLSFSSEDDRVTDFVQLPQSVLHLVLNDKEDFPDGSPSGVHCEDREQPENEPRREILCRKLFLSSQAGENYLVIGVGGLRGAHIVPFWLLHRDRRGASLLLKTRSDQIEIMPRWFNGYAEVRSTWIEGAGATIITESFRFDGNTYVKYRSQTQHQ